MMANSVKYSSITIERENCCDDLAVAACGDSIALARALTVMESIRCENPALAPTANGGVLTNRIRRLLIVDQKPLRSVWPIGLIGILLAGICLAVLPMFSSDASAMNSPDGKATIETVPATNAVSQTTIRTDVETKPEIRKKDSKTGIEQRVFSDIMLIAGNDAKLRQSRIDMKYSNVIPYSFIPRRAAKELRAVKLGELDFTRFKNAGRPVDVTWLIVPNDFVNPMGYIQDGVSHYFLDYLNEPTDNPIVPYPDDHFFAPDHLGFYGMNQTRQLKFDVVRIREIDLGIGKKFGPVNALVLDDENSEFGLLGSKWARKVSGKKGGMLMHAAVGEFRIYPPPKEPLEVPDESTEHHNKLRQSDDGNDQKQQKNLPDFEVIEQNGRIRHVSVNSINIRRTPAELLKHFSSTIGRHGPQKGISITNMESIVSANPTKRFDKLVEANEIIFSLPEGSRSRASIIGDAVEISKQDETVEIIVTNGSVQWIDSVGVIRAKASPDGGAEQLVVSARISNDEVVLKMKTRRIEPSPDYPDPPVQVVMNVETGAPSDENQPPHGSVRYEIFEASEEEDKPMRLKMKWRYDLNRLAQEAEKQTGQKWDAIIWGVDKPKQDPRR